MLNHCYIYMLIMISLSYLKDMRLPFQWYSEIFRVCVNQWYGEASFYQYVIYPFALVQQTNFKVKNFNFRLIKRYNFSSE